MSGNIKYIGKNNTSTQLPTSGFGFSVSNSDGKDNALKKFVSSFTDNKTKQSMATDFSPDLVQKITENANNPKVLNNVLKVKQTPLNNKDCSVFTISPINSSIENSVSTNPLSSEGLLVRDNGEEINSLKEQTLNEMLNKKQVEIAELQSQLQSQLQLKQEGEKDLVLLLQKEIKLLKLFENELDLYRFRNEIGTKVNMNLQKTIISIKTLLETTKQTREQVSQSDFQPLTVEIDTELSQSDLKPSTVEIMKKSATALLEAEKIIHEFEAQARGTKPQQPSNVKKEEKLKNPVVVKIDNIGIEKQRIRDATMTLAETFYNQDPKTKETNMNRVKNELNRTSKIEELELILNGAKKNKFIKGGSKASRRERFRSRKAKAHKNKTKTRKYRKRSFTRRRK